VKNLQGKRILILSDGSPRVGALAPRLRAAGVELTVVTDARDIPKPANGALDGVLAFFNPHRPGMSQLLARARSTQAAARAPVLIVAGEVDADGVKRLAALGVADILMAPAGPDDIVARLERALAPPPSRPERYDVRLINAFVTAGREILEFYLGAAPEVGKPSIKQGNQAAGFVSGLIAFSASDSLGSLSATFDRRFVDLLAAKTFGESTTPLEDAAYADLAGEMCNQILGKAQASFAELGIRMQIGLPEVVVGEGHSVFHKVANPIIMIPIRSGETTCVIEFAMGRGVAPAPA
jgi:CheY-specific phosphatase CheX